MHYKHDRHKPQTPRLTGRQCLKKIHTLPFQVHIKMRQLNCSNIYLRHGPGNAQSYYLCCLHMKILKANIWTNKKEPN